MKKSLQELLTYIWIPFMLGFVFYIFQNQHDLPLAIVLLIAFSAIYTLVRVYFAQKSWWSLAAAALVIAGTLGFVFLRPQGITLSVNDQVMISSSVSLNDGKVFVNPSPGPDGKYAKGTVVSLTASPNAGYDLKSWKGTSNDISNPTTITMSGRQNVSVVFKSRSSLIVNNQEVIGSIVSFTEGSVSINPGPEEDGKYTQDTIVTLTANPNSGYDWKNWTATDGNASNPTTVTMSSRKQVSVSFEPRSLLYINNQVVSDATMSFNEGSVIVNPAPGADDKYAKGTVISMTAKPDSGYGLKNWSGTGSDVSNPTTVTINSDKHVTVTFELRFPLVINNVPVSGPSANLTEGSVSLSPAPGADARYAKDATITLTAQAGPGYRFDHWSGDASGTATAVSITVNSAKNITAVFKQVYTLTNSVNATGGGSVSPPSGIFDAGSTVTLTAAPAAGYRFDRWYGDASGTSATFTVTMNSDKTTSAAFRKVYALTTSVSPAGSGTVTPASGSYDAGAILTLIAQDASGYRFDHWEGDASGNVTANLTMTSNKTVIAFFKSLTP